MIVRFVNAQVSWRARRDPASDRWVGICDALRLTAEGETWDELLSVSSEILSALLTDLLEEGELDRFLTDMKWQPKIRIPKHIPKGGILWDVPIEVMQDRAYAQA